MNPNLNRFSSPSASQNSLKLKGRLAKALLAITTFVTTGCQSIQNDLWDESRCSRSIHAVSPFCRNVDNNGDGGSRDNGRNTSREAVLSDKDQNGEDTSSNNDCQTGTSQIVTARDNSINIARNGDNSPVTQISEEGSGDLNVTINHITYNGAHSREVTPSQESTHFYDTYRERMIQISNAYQNSDHTTLQSVDYIDRFLNALDEMINTRNGRLSNDIYHNAFQGFSPEMHSICREICNDLSTRIVVPNTCQQVQNYCQQVLRVR